MVEKKERNISETTNERDSLGSIAWNETESIEKARKIKIIIDIKEMRVLKRVQLRWSRGGGVEVHGELGLARALQRHRIIPSQAEIIAADR